MNRRQFLVVPFLGAGCSAHDFDVAPKAVFRLGSALRCSCLSADGSLLAVGTDACIRVFRTSHLRTAPDDGTEQMRPDAVVATLLGDHRGISDLAFTPGNLHLLSVRQLGGGPYYGLSTEMSSWRLQESLRLARVVVHDGIAAITTVPSGGVAAVGTHRGKIRCFALPNLSRENVIATGAHSVRAVASMEQPEVVVALLERENGIGESVSTSVSTFDVASGAEVADYNYLEGVNAGAKAVAVGGKSIAVAGRDHCAILSLGESGLRPMAFKKAVTNWHTCRVAFAPGNDEVAFAGDGCVLVRRAEASLGLVGRPLGRCEPEWATTFGIKDYDRPETLAVGYFDGGARLVHAFASGAIAVYGR